VVESIEYLFKQRVLNALYEHMKGIKMIKNENMQVTVSDLLDELYSEIEQAEDNVQDAKNNAYDAKSSADEAHDYADYAEGRLDTMKETVNQLRDMSGEFSTKKAKTELTKLIDSLTKQQAKLG